jgi:hypothetical protein
MVAKKDTRLMIRKLIMIRIRIITTTEHFPCPIQDLKIPQTQKLIYVI